MVITGDFPTKEVDFVNSFLLDLHQRSYEKYKEREGPWGQIEHLESLSSFQPVGPREWLERRLPSVIRREGRLLEGKFLIFLDFIKKEKALPILDMQWDFRRNHPMTVRFLFFLLHWEEGKNRPQAVGFRLDSPEGPGGERGPGTHDYWHGQMIAEFEKDSNQIQTLIGATSRWIPIRQPAFPLPAKKIGDLFAVLLLSLYGARQLREFKDLEGFADLSKRLDGMGIRPA